MKTVSVSAPGNLFVAGEHSCVYTDDALIVSPGLRTTVHVEPSESQLVSVASEAMDLRASVPVDDSRNLNGVPLQLAPTFMLVERAARDSGRELEPMEVTIESDIPIGGGLSSSTALLVAGYFAVARALGGKPWKLDEQEVLRRLLPLQTLIHGRASGIELFSSHLGGFSRVTDGKVRRYEAGAPACVVGDTCEPRETSRVVSMVARWRGAHARRCDEIFKGISGITDNAAAAVGSADWESLGALLTENHRLLQKLGPDGIGRRGVSNDKLDAMVEAAVKSGAYGAKLSGAGWGGVMFAICPPEAQESVAEALGALGKAYSTTLGAEGVREDQP